MLRNDEDVEADEPWNGTWYRTGRLCEGLPGGTLPVCLVELPANLLPIPYPTGLLFAVQHVLFYLSSASSQITEGTPLLMLFVNLLSLCKRVFQERTILTLPSLKMFKPFTPFFL